MGRTTESPETNLDGGLVWLLAVRDDELFTRKICTSGALRGGGAQVPCDLFFLILTERALVLSGSDAFR